MRANNLLDAPIVPTLARLAAPGIALALFQTAVSVADTYYVGRLGTDSLAGLALVFPMLMLLQMTSAGAMGGGVSSAVARALGAGNPDAARRLVVHGLIIALGGGLFFTLFLLGAGQMLMPMLANTARLALVGAGGVLVMQLGGPAGSAVRRRRAWVGRIRRTDRLRRVQGALDARLISVRDDARSGLAAQRAREVGHVGDEA